MSSYLSSVVNFLFPPKMPISDAKKQQIDDAIKSDHVFIASKSYCPYCKRAKQIIINQHGVKADVIELNEVEEGSEIQDYLEKITGQRTVPNIFIDGKHIGGCSDVETLEKKGELAAML